MITIQLPEPRSLSQLSRNHKPILRNPPRKKSRKRRKVRAKGHRNKRCTFDQTPIGYLIKHECPVEWRFITDIKTANGLNVTADFLENLAYMSDNPFFRTEKFRRALMDFREYGYVTPNRKGFDLDDELRYIRDRIRRTKRLER